MLITTKTNTGVKAFLKSFISDRGNLFSCYKELEKEGIKFYFSDPYSGCQIGSNENPNGLLREHHPKKTDLSTIFIYNKRRKFNES